MFIDAYPQYMNMWGLNDKTLYGKDDHGKA
jgi:hypothetical protein